MATVDQTDKLNQQQPGAGQGQADLGAQGAPGAAAGGTAMAGGTGGQGANTTGVGSGGQGMWTNIQSYLDANKNNTGSADKLNKTVGGQFDQEKQNAQSQSDQYRQNAQKAVDSANIGQDQASQLVKQASQNYNYSGNQTDAYNQPTQQIQNFLNSSYQAPQAFAYGTSNQTQQMGSNLNNDNAFGQMMSGIYSQAAGQPLTQGQSNLQNELDANNPALQTARQNLLGQYSTLGTDLNNLVTNTNDTSQYANQYATNQNALRDYLTGQAGTARTGYNTALTNTIQNYMKPFQSSLADAQKYNRWATGQLSDSEKADAQAYMNAHPTGDYGSVYGTGVPVDDSGNPINPQGDALWHEMGNTTDLQPTWASSNLNTAQQSFNNASQQPINQNIDDSDKRMWNAIEQMLGKNDFLPETQTQAFGTGYAPKKVGGTGSGTNLGA